MFIKRGNKRKKNKKKKKLNDFSPSLLLKLAKRLKTLFKPFFLRK